MKIFERERKWQIGSPRVVERHFLAHMDEHSVAPSVLPIEEITGQTMAARAMHLPYCLQLVGDDVCASASQEQFRSRLVRATSSRFRNAWVFSIGEKTSVRIEMGRVARGTREFPQINTGPSFCFCPNRQDRCDASIDFSTAQFFFSSFFFPRGSIG